MYYIQRESKNQTGVDNGYPIIFDTGISVSGTNDFRYQPAGIIDIKKPGIYVVSWFVNQMTGLSKDGQVFHIKKSYNDALTWTEVAGASSHIKISSSSGFCAIEVSKEDIEDHEYVSIALFNTSDKYATLTNHNHAKAGILVFGYDINALESRVTNIEQNITNIYQKIDHIESFIYLSDVVDIWSVDPALRKNAPARPEPGIGTGVIHAGYTYNFWGIGSLDHQQTLDNSSTYYILRNDSTITQCPELLLYQGDSTIGTLWIETPGGVVYNVPLRFDATGIYFKSQSQLSNLPVGTTFKFTQALILVDPD